MHKMQYLKEEVMCKMQHPEMEAQSAQDAASKKGGAACAKCSSSQKRKCSVCNMQHAQNAVSKSGNAEHANAAMARKGACSAATAGKGGCSAAHRQCPLPGCIVLTCQKNATCLRCKCCSASKSRNAKKCKRCSHSKKRKSERCKCCNCPKKEPTGCKRSSKEASRWANTGLCAGVYNIGRCSIL